MNANPDYTSESSPRSLLAEVEKVVIERVGKNEYVRHLIEVAEIVEEQAASVSGIEQRQDVRVAEPGARLYLLQEPLGA